MPVWEATAPCALRLGPCVAVALDRRAWCRIEARPGELEFESKDVPPQRIVATGLMALVPGASLEWSLPLLRAAGVDAGLRIAIHGRVPAGTGLAVSSAQAVALGAALSAWAGSTVEAASVAQLVLGSASGARASTSIPELEVWTALLGGVVTLPGAGEPGRRLALDPGKLEERLLLVEVGLPAMAVPSARASDRPADGLLQALGAGAWDEVGALLDVELAESLPGESVAGQIARRAQTLGGRAWMCVAGAAGLMGVWISPDGRRALLDWMRTGAAGARPVASRLDLLGFEVESA